MKLASIAAEVFALSAAPAQARTTQEVTACSNTDNVLTYGTSYNQNRYSTLTQINNGNTFNAFNTCITCNMFITHERVR